MADIWGKTLTISYDLYASRTKVEDSLGGVTTSLYDAAKPASATGTGGRATSAFDAVGQMAQTFSHCRVHSWYDGQRGVPIPSG